MSEKKEKVDNTEKYKVKYCKRKNPFFKWIFSIERKYKSRIISFLLFGFISFFNLMYFLLNCEFGDAPYGLSIILPFICGGFVFNVLELATKWKSLFRGESKFKKKDFLNNFALSGILVSMYMVNFLVLFGLTYLTTLIGIHQIWGLGTTLFLNYIFSVYMNWEIEISDEVKDLKLEKDDIRELRLEQILGK